MYRRVITTVILIFISIQVFAQEGSVLAPVWNDTLKGKLKASVDIKLAEIVDIDKNGYDDIIVVTSGNPTGGDTTAKNRIYVMEGNGSIHWISGVDGWIRDAQLFDVDRDDTFELLISTGREYSGIQRGKLYLYSSRGTIARVNQDSFIYDKLHITDLNFDQYYEVIGGSRSRASLYGIGLEKKWFYPKINEELFVKGVDEISSGMINDYSSSKEIVIGVDDLHIINENGILASIHSFQERQSPLKKGFKYLRAGSFTKSSLDSIFAVTKDDKVHLAQINDTSIEVRGDEYRFNLTDLWTYDPECEITSIKTLNMDDDDELDILLGCNNKKIQRLGLHGRPLWSYYCDGEIRDIEYSDLDDDKIDDIILFTSAGTVYSLNKNGEFMWKYETEIDSHNLMIGDLNGNQKNELALVDEQTNLIVFHVDQDYVLRKKGDRLFNIGQEYYWKNQFHDAQEKLIQARDVFYQINYTYGIYEADKLINEIESKRVDEIQKEADTYYDKAQESFIAGDYNLAMNYLDRAKSLYIGFGDSDAILKCELMALRIKDMKDNVKTGSTLPFINMSGFEDPDNVDKPINQNIYIGVGVLVVVLVIIIAVKKRGGKDDDLLNALSSDNSGDDWGEIEV